MKNPLELIGQLTQLPAALIAIASVSHIAADVSQTKEITKEEAEEADRVLWPFAKVVDTIQRGEIAEGLLALDDLEDAIQRVLKAAQALTQPAKLGA